MNKEKQNGRWKKIGLALVALLVVAAAVREFVPTPMLAHLMGHNPGGVHGHGADGGGHDEVNMPGLRGENATDEESEELRVLFRNFATLTRKVENLPDGIRTVTSSSDETVMANLVSHVTGMINRVGEKDDPKILVQSPTLDIFFARGDAIKSQVEVTDEGIVVVQTSADPEIVKALHIHAEEVTQLAARGMAALHEQMQKRAEN